MNTQKKVIGIGAAVAAAVSTIWLMKPLPPIDKMAPYPQPGPVAVSPSPTIQPTLFPEFVYQPPPQVKKKATSSARVRQQAAGFTCATAQSHSHNDIVEVTMDISAVNGCVVIGTVNGASVSVLGGGAFPADIRLPQLATVRYDRTCGQVSYWKFPGGIATTTLPPAKIAADRISR